MKAFVTAAPAGLLLALLAGVASAQEPRNLLLNGAFAFHAFDNSRSGSARAFSSGSVPCWNTAAYDDATVTSVSHVDGLTPRVWAPNILTLAPGKRISQTLFLPEIGVRHGETVSLQVDGTQQAPDSLRASLHVLKLDSQDGVWCPTNFGLKDKREFPRHARGELVRAASYPASSGAASNFLVKIEGCSVVGRFITRNESGDDQTNAIALQVEFENVGAAPLHLYAPTLVKGAQALDGVAELRPVPTAYRSIPRTLRKLWRGEALHVLVMGSSIDRGSANPPLYLYDEDPASPTFKQPLAEGAFDGARVGRPDLTASVGRWQHAFSWAGRLRLELLARFNLAPEQLCFNFMACDGSSISEATSGLEAYCTLAVPCNAEESGQHDGGSWSTLYPELFSRPQGPGPDLVLFGSGANEKTDQPDEGAIFEATIRWIQQRYPDCEFLACMFQQGRSYTPNIGHLQEIALGYQIPLLDLSARMDLLLRWSNRYALLPADGHPQAAGHFIWYQQVAEAFQAADPILPGLGQLRLPRRLNPYSYGWEGDITTYTTNSPRLRERRLLVLDDTTVNCWAACATGKTVACWIDGDKKREARPQPRRDLRNSTFAYGRLALGDRHILEIAGDEAALLAADCKTAPNRRFIGVDSGMWQLAGAPLLPFASAWGAPYGSQQAVVGAGGAIEIEAVGSDLALAYVDAAQGGSFRVWVDGRERLQVTAREAFVAADGTRHYLENRKGLRELGYGAHRLRVEVTAGEVAFLGLFTYDARPNRDRERLLAGRALPGETLVLSPAFTARPLVLCEGGLTAAPAQITPTQVTFGGSGPGSYHILGE